MRNTRRQPHGVLSSIEAQVGVWRRRLGEGVPHRLCDRINIAIRPPPPRPLNKPSLHVTRQWPPAADNFQKVVCENARTI